MLVRTVCFLAAAGVASNAAVGDGAVKLWIEAESYTSQKGSLAASFSLPKASGGATVAIFRPSPLSLRYFFSSLFFCSASSYSFTHCSGFV